MEMNNLEGIIESLLFAAGDEGLTIKQISEVLEMETIVAVDILSKLVSEYNENQKRGIMIVQLAETYQLVTKKEYSPFLKKLVESPNNTALSQAALETLAIIAYKQPITRIEIEEIRGVKTDRPLQTLTAKALIKEMGRVEGPGRAYLYGTTKEFLDYFGLRNIKELPPLPEKLEEENIQEEADLFFERFQDHLDT
ncbi:MAG TPA: SMC-Scp complex subunit ScpB [Bacillus sp. (in: firmicutes)]|nr:SMC-Scp complex subunit ScpB [Bacillus sp. (in: firmicutes)]HVI20498.1 SMC-Scp complex subunit ScpB [Bacillus sp. (in: firmicutes)]